MNAATMTDQTAGRLARAWLALAVAAFALSALFAAALVVARAPFLPFPALGPEGFRAALVTHVNLAVLVWFLAFGVLQWLRASPVRDESVRWLALVLAVLGTGVMVAATFAGGTPLLANYFPALDHPLFYAGSVWFVLAILMTVSPGLRALASGLRESDAARLGVCLAVLPLLAALLSFAWSWLQAPAVSEWDTAQYEGRIWGAGHLAQFTYILLMMVVWWQLAGPKDAGPRATCLARLALWLTVLPALAGPALHAVYASDPAGMRRAYTLLMSVASWPGALIMAAVCIRHLGRGMDSFARAAFITSALLFIAGCLFGAFIQRDSTLVPAHYHGTIGAVTIAFMAWIYRHGTEFGLQPDMRRALKQLTVYGAGLALLAAGLAASALAGAQRKMAHAEVLQSGSGYLFAMSLAAVGGLLALFGAAWFVLNIVRGMQHRTARNARRKDVRLRALAVTSGVIMAAGFAVAWWPQPDPLAGQRQHVRAKQAEEMRARFEQGVVMLHSKQYEHALTAFHRVLTMAPDMPEAHVNTGFALIGLERFKEARDFFESATELRKGQLNAYYGLALSLEGLNDLPGALGAMRTYVHLSKPDDPYRRKAEAALWEWEAEVAQVRARHASAAAAADSGPASTSPARKN